MYRKISIFLSIMIILVSLSACTNKTENIETVLALSVQGMGITFYPKMFMSPDPASRSYRSAVLEQNHLNLYSLNYTRAHGVLGIGYHKGRYMSRAAHEFIRIAKERLDYAPKK